MRMRSYRIYTTEAQGCVYLMTPNPNCVTGLNQNVEVVLVGSSETVHCNLSDKMAFTRMPAYNL